MRVKGGNFEIALPSGKTHCNYYGYCCKTNRKLALRQIIGKQSTLPLRVHPEVKL